MRIGITGAGGFLGWHTRCAALRSEIDVALADRSTFADPAKLDAFTAQSDAILHLAGVNRASSDSEVAAGNKFLADELSQSMKRVGSAPTVVYSNTTKIGDDSVYGQAKREAADILSSACSDLGGRFHSVVLPHLFGEYGVPFYNSAVTTFAHQFAIGQEPTVSGDGQLELLHAQTAAANMLELALQGGPPETRLAGRLIGVADAATMLRSFHNRYVGEGTIPRYDDLFELQMFNMLRSQLYLNDYYPVDLTLHADPRGSFAEIIRADGLGQTSISTTVPGISRGDHYHLHKIERFVVVGGKAQINLRRLFTNEIKRFDVQSESPVLIDMPPLCTHNIINTGDDLLTTLFWAGDHFDPGNPDTYAELVEVAQ